MKLESPLANSPSRSKKLHSFLSSALSSLVRENDAQQAQQEINAVSWKDRIYNYGYRYLFGEE